MRGGSAKFNIAPGRQLPSLRHWSMHSSGWPILIFLFNISYVDLIEELISNINTGTFIHGISYNAFCYADDIMLSSLTASGLQTLISAANRYITAHGLKFNPTKTYTTFGKKNIPAPESNLEYKWKNLKETDRVPHSGYCDANKVLNHLNSRVGLQLNRQTSILQFTKCWIMYKWSTCNNYGTPYTLYTLLFTL